VASSFPPGSPQTFPQHIHWRELGDPSAGYWKLTVSRHPYIREKYTRNIIAARELARDYFEYETKVETWREVPPDQLKSAVVPFRLARHHRKRKPFTSKVIANSFRGGLNSRTRFVLVGAYQ
jgi:hypothetical protein